jgi:hypothetical protein
MPVPLTSQCRDILKSCYCNISIACRQSRSIALMLLPQNNMEPKNKHLPLLISCQNSPLTRSRKARIIGSILYYAQAVDITVLMALSYIAIKQSKGTINTMQKAKQLLDYLATYPDATICFRASNMIMNIHSDASYSSKSDAQS